jgi:hypothetical protein
MSKTLGVPNCACEVCLIVYVIKPENVSDCVWEKTCRCVRLWVWASVWLCQNVYVSRPVDVEDCMCQKACRCVRLWVWASLELGQIICVSKSVGMSDCVYEQAYRQVRFYMWASLYVCQCVCVRERERQPVGVPDFDCEKQQILRELLFTEVCVISFWTFRLPIRRAEEEESHSCLFLSANRPLKMQNDKVEEHFTGRW